MTISDGEHTAVVDRVEDGRATLRFDAADGTDADLAVDAQSLPRRAQRAGAVVHVTLVDEELIDVAYDRNETRRRRSGSEDR